MRRIIFNIRIFFAHDASEDAVDDGKDAGITSKVIVQRKQGPFLPCAVKIAAVKKHLRFGMTEAVDALLDISHEEDVVFSKALYDRILNAAVVLIFIDIDLAEKISVVGGYFRMRKKLKCHLFLIREIHAVLEFFLLRIYSFCRKYQFEISFVDRIHIRHFFRKFRQRLSEEIARLAPHLFDKRFRLSVSGNDIGKFRKDARKFRKCDGIRLRGFGCIIRHLLGRSLVFK